MYLALAPRLRKHLRSEQYADGLTSAQLSLLVGSSPKRVNDALRIMPDAYIDRWVKSVAANGQTRRYAAVWCVVEVPEHCPKPTEV